MASSLLVLLVAGASAHVYNTTNVRLRRQAIIANADRSNLWSTTEPIPYYFETGGYAVSAQVRQLFYDSTRFWADRTCLSFQENKQPVSKIRVISANGCYSQLGRYSTKQEQSLSLWNGGCNTMNLVLHEIEHALGVDHQMKRSDRDPYLRVYENNIVAGIRTQYQKEMTGRQTFNLPYEYGSIMHYTGNSAAANPGTPTMEATNADYQNSMGSHEPSFLDVQIVNLLYNCASKCRAQLPCKNYGYTHPKKCNVCICPEGWGGAYCDQNPAGAVVMTATQTFQRGQISYGGAASNVAQNRAYIINAPAGKRVELKFDSLSSTDYLPSCEKNGIEIKTKTNDLRPRGIRFCGPVTPPKSYYSDGNKMVIMAFYYSGQVTGSFQYRYAETTGSTVYSAV